MPPDVVTLIADDGTTRHALSSRPLTGSVNIHDMSTVFSVQMRDFPMGQEGEARRSHRRTGKEWVLGRTKTRQPTFPLHLQAPCNESGQWSFSAATQLFQVE